MTTFPFLTDAQIHSAALGLKLDALPGAKAAEVPVDLEAIVFDFLCERDGLIVDDESPLADENGEEVLGKTTISPGRIQISSHLSKDSGRYRFTLAHEIGHWILHRPILMAALEQPNLFGTAALNPTLTTLNRAMTDAAPPREEVQANIFASSLLIDQSRLRSEFLDRFGDGDLMPVIRSAGLEKGGARLQARFLATAGKAPHLAGLFAVSADAMGIAIISRKLLPTGSPLFGQGS